MLFTQAVQVRIEVVDLLLKGGDVRSHLLELPANCEQMHAVFPGSTHSESWTEVEQQLGA